MSDKYYLGEDHVPVPIPEGELLEWARWFETADRTVKKESVGPYLVSTVFLGLDHRFSGDGPPILFETLVFRDHRSAWNDLGGRCSTWKQAERMHAATVAEVKELAATVAEEKL